MITAQVGQRIVSRRRGCRPNRGTVVRVDSYDEENRYHWVTVEWDNGGLSMVNSSESRLSNLKRG